MAQHKRPFIGINTDFIPAGRTTTAHLRLHSGFVDAIVSVGGLPLLVPPLAKEADLETYLSQVDGFLFTGGLDLDPRRHGLPPHPAMQLMPTRRDDSDRYLMRKVLERKLPLLAVGVGMQQLNVARGGNLWMHLPEEQPRAMPHRDQTGAPHRHLVIVEPNTRMDEIYGTPELLVNSAHHQSVKSVGAGLRVCAKAPDGVIEAVESVDPNWFCIGVQWHP